MTTWLMITSMMSQIVVGKMTKLKARKKMMIFFEKEEVSDVLPSVREELVGEEPLVEEPYPGAATTQV